MQKDSSRYEMMCRAAARARKARSGKNATKEFIQQRFWSKVDRKGPNDCWNWLAGCAGRGYGAFRLKKTKIGAHRFAWECFNGPIPDGLIACHHCDNVLCCNPNHLFIGTDQDNIDDCMKKGRKRVLKGEEHGCSKLTESDVLEIRRLYLSGHLSKDIAREFGLRKQHVYQIVSGNTWRHVNHKLPCKARPAVGEYHGQHVLTSKDVLWVLEVYKPRVFSMQKIADRLGVKISAVFDIIHHRTWKHLTRAGELMAVR